MDYEMILERIHSLNKYGSRPGLDRVKKLLELMGDPQDRLRFVHVAGTNGKGSVCAMISSVLRCAGYKTGLFISPYITDFCERIQISNMPISHESLAEVAKYVFLLVDKLNAEGVIITEFEFVMCVAFEYFARQNCDIVVLETGLGGLLDCTNVIKAPYCTVLTPIGLDHTDILGDTVEAIARQKCGIIKEGSYVVSARQCIRAQKVIEETCESLSVQCVFPDAQEARILSSSLEGTVFEYDLENIKISLLGEHQVENAVVAYHAVDRLIDCGFRITDDAIERGFETAINPARFELMGTRPGVIIDGAHNPDGMKAFAASVKKYFPESRGVLIIGMLADKDSKGAVKCLEGLFSQVYTVPVSNPRAMSSKDMAALMGEHFDKVEKCDSVEDAFDKAYDRVSRHGGFLCVCGSLYLAGEIRPYVLKKIRSRKIIRLFDN